MRRLGLCLRVACSGLLLIGASTSANASSADENDEVSTVELEAEALPQAQRRDLELSARRNPYAISPHKPNFLLPLSWSRRTHGAPFNVSDSELQNFEVKFQLSFKVAIWEEPLSLPLDLYFAYTGRSFWQAFNRDKSAPFRDTNHEPEAFVSTFGDWELGPLRDINMRAGFSHQSNGQPLPLSRSWNRIYTGVEARWRRFFLDLVLWDRLPEDPKDGPDDPKGDDNPDIERYIGNGQFSVGWVIDNKTVRVSLRNNLRADNRGALTAAFTYPINTRLKGYVEFFSGYGETLIDYNHSNERLSVGIALSDWP